MMFTKRQPYEAPNAIAVEVKAQRNFCGSYYAAPRQQLGGWDDLGGDAWGGSAGGANGLGGWTDNGDSAW